MGRTVCGQQEPLKWILLPSRYKREGKDMHLYGRDPQAVEHRTTSSVLHLGRKGMPIYSSCKSTYVAPALLPFEFTKSIFITLASMPYEFKKSIFIPPALDIPLKLDFLRNRLSPHNQKADFRRNKPL